MEVWKKLILDLAVSRGFSRGVDEYRFHPERKWRFDLAWPEYKVAFERDGATWTGGRHTTGAGFRNDCEKLNAAQVMGWIVIRGTADMIESGSVYTDLLAALSGRAATHAQTGDQ